ncbi:hypothetical protein GcC1_179010 [Golovinomyces cichoracearum]|uniref:RNA helicase HEL117 n=1 Tax=Golovinomyces cichoracearum TaxID=62708 RepID=A0A420HNN5_9PEZI|nr:hypothetical protein GcC1_179010 [Golovinomyces cichoracearum]
MQLNMANHARLKQTEQTIDPPQSHSPQQQFKKNHRDKHIPPHHNHHHHYQRKRKRSPPATPAVLELPFNSRPLIKRDFKQFKHLFGLYLEIQKGKYLEDLSETEIKGRWKSFINKWNLGKLSEGWYDPSTIRKASEHADIYDSRNHNEEPSDLTSSTHGKLKTSPRSESVEGSDSDQSFGPMLPDQEITSKTRRLGPTIPGTQELQVIRETREEDRLARRNEIISAQRAERKEQKAALDELVPRAMPNSRERQLEKKKELNEKMKAFREKSPGAADIPDTELMGGGEDLESYKRIKKEVERKKNDRELRKEENLRARIAEREERLREYRAKEAGTMAMLMALAKQRLG